MMHEDQFDFKDGFDWSEWWVECTNDDCRVQPEAYGTFKTEAEAIAAWNTRAVEVCEVVGFADAEPLPIIPERTCKSVFDGNMDGTSVCSECGGEFPQDPDRRWRLNYCPNCGARVIGGEQ